MRARGQYPLYDLGTRVKAKYNLNALSGHRNLFKPFAYPC